MQLAGLLVIVAVAVVAYVVNRSESGSGTGSAAPVAASGSRPSGGARSSAAADPGTGGTSSLPFGAGPQSRYTVQPQPPAGTCHYRHEGTYPLPDPVCTPGARNPRVTQANLRTTICRSGYSSDIRPPVDITGREKAANVRSYGYTGSTTTGEYDHLISLQLGGDPNDARNLWVEPNDRAGATSTNNSKDTVENAAHDAICSGKLTLEQVRVGIATNWVTLGRRLGVSLPG